MDARLLWTPSAAFAEQSNLNKYTEWLNRNKQLFFDDYHALWQWSVDHIDEFWSSLWEYFNIIYDGQITDIVGHAAMPRTTWFEGTYLNYAEHIFRNENNTHPAIVFKSESGKVQTISWQDLKRQVAAVRSFLKEKGIRPGDRVAGYLPCIPEATIAFLAASSLGAIWSSCSPDFGTPAAIDRFAQIEPAVLIAVDKYQYGGKTFDRSEAILSLSHAIPGLQHIIIVSEKESSSLLPPHTSWRDILNDTTAKLEFTRVPFNHPLWVLYSSGTTGLPKAITHAHGGILLEQLKYCTFHNDFKPGERCFWYTTTGWMMWNYIHGSLLSGATMVLYDGSPAYPDMSVLWKFCEEAEIHHFGTSAGFILANMKIGTEPGRDYNLSALRSIGSTGSTLPPEGFEWIYGFVKKDLWLASMSGGTDVCSAFVGGNPMLPVYAGEIQCRALGCKLEAYDAYGRAVENEVGEMVITKPMPSMPVFFWNDPGFERYHESYFEMFPGVWRHGDWTEITERHGVIIYGRSDATLNRGGIRIGTSEIYRAVDKIKEVKDSVVICIEREQGTFWMPLFVVLQPGVVLNDDLKKKINTTIREEYTPRHVPDEIVAVPDIPYTISGKKTETPVKKVLMGKDPKSVVNRDALKNPAAMDFFIQLAGKISRQ